MLKELRELGYTATIIDDGKLRVTGSEKKPNELNDRIRENKQSILTELREEAWEQIVRLWESERGLSVDDTAAAVIEACNDEYETDPLTWMIRLAKDGKIERDLAATARAMRIAEIEPSSGDYFSGPKTSGRPTSTPFAGHECSCLCDDDEKELEDMDMKELLERAREHDAEAVREMEMRDGVEEETYA